MQNDDSLLNQLVLLLAGSGMSDEQLMRLLRKLRTATPSLILEHVNVCRGTFASRARSLNDGVLISSDTTRSASIDKEAINNVERLVIVEAGLSKMVAARAIIQALRSRHPTTKFPSFNSKDGFAKWLSLISETVPLAELLHVAASLRNEFVHTPKDDWIKGSN